MIDNKIVAQTIHKFVVDTLIWSNSPLNEVPPELKKVGISRCEINEGGAFICYLESGIQFDWGKYL